MCTGLAGFAVGDEDVGVETPLLAAGPLAVLVTVVTAPGLLDEQALKINAPRAVSATAMRVDRGRRAFCTPPR
jgi:hypothetical protein